VLTQIFYFEGFNLKDVGGSVQSHNAQAISSGCGTSVANQSNDNCSLAASKTEKQKTNKLKVAMDTEDPFAPLQGNLHPRVPLWNASTSMHTAWGISRKN